MIRRKVSKRTAWVSFVAEKHQRLYLHSTDVSWYHRLDPGEYEIVIRRVHITPTKEAFAALSYVFWSIGLVIQCAREHGLV